MRNIETFPSKQMYPYLSLAKRKVADFYLNIDRMRWLVWLKWLIFITFSAQFMVSLNCWFFTNYSIGSLFIALHRLPLWILYKMTKFIMICNMCTVHTPNPNSNTKGENSLSSSQLFCFNIWSVLTSFDPSRCYLQCNQTCILDGEAFWLFFLSERQGNPEIKNSVCTKRWLEI